MDSGLDWRRTLGYYQQAKSEYQLMSHLLSNFSVAFVSSSTTISQEKAIAIDNKDHLQWVAHSDYRPISSELRKQRPHNQTMVQRNVTHSLSSFGRSSIQDMEFMVRPRKEGDTKVH